MAHEQENPKYCVQTKFAATINNLKKLSEVDMILYYI